MIGLISPCLCEEEVQTQTKEAEIIFVMGAAGESKFEEPFLDSMARVKSAAQLSPAGLNIIHKPEDGTQPKEKLKILLDKLNQDSAVPVWLIFVGHGTFDGIDAKFNLEGPDLESKELAEWVKDYQRPSVIVLGFSCSSPFLPLLSTPNRIVISATRSGYESNFSRFGIYFCRSLTESLADLDKDNQVSLLEAFLYASSTTRKFYEDEERLISEHSLIDDSGDQKGTPAEWFKGLQPKQTPKGANDIDGFKAHQVMLIPDEFERSLSPESRQKRNNLENKLRLLKAKKDTLSGKDYQASLEEILTQLAEIYYPNSQ